MNDLSFIHHQLLLEDLYVPQMLPAICDHQFEPDQALSCKRSAAQTDLQTLEQKPIMKQHKTSISNNNNWNNKSYDEMINNHDKPHVLMNSLDNSSNMLSFSNNSSSCSNQTSSSLITPKEEVVISNEMLVSSSQQASSVERRHIEVSPQVGCMAQRSMDHIIAERKRREKLSQKFVSLSAIIPGLKKTDKASVLGDAIKYVKQLQERVTKLEDEAKKKTMESAVSVKKSYVSAHEDDPFSEQTTLSGDGEFPEIEARFSDKDVLIIIHCDKKKRVVEKIISKIEELNLVVSSSSSLAFGGSTLALTIIAQMGAEFSMTATDLVKHIRTALKYMFHIIT